MKTHDLVQGTEAWHAYRSNHFNASDAPAMMGVSPYKTRTQLLHELHTGLTAEVDQATQRRFDDGHRFEALARPLAEEFIGVELYPVVGSKGKLSASFDGLSMSEDVGFEHKSLNENLRTVMVDGCTGADLPPMYQIQMEQQCIVAGCARILFMSSKWMGDELVEERHCWYETNLELRQQIMHGWTQFAIDLAAYAPAVIIEAPKAEAMMGLPALVILIKGEVVSSNLSIYRQAADSYISAINTTLTTDQHFADAEATVKFCEKAEKDLDLTKAAAISQTASIDELLRTVDHIKAQLRDKRLMLGKLVDKRKAEIKDAIILSVKAAYAEHLASLEAEIDPMRLVLTAPDFAGATKNKRTLASLRDAVDSELAAAKIAANAAASGIRAKLTWYKANALSFNYLFHDLHSLIQKQQDDFELVITTRIDAHKAAEAAKEEATRVRIQAEEQAKAEKEAADRQADINAAALGEIQGIQQQVYIATTGRLGVRKGGTIECIRETLAETEAWVIDNRFGALQGAAQGAKDSAVASIRNLLASSEEKQAHHGVETAQAAIENVAPVPPITHEVVAKIMMPPAVRQAMAPKPASIPSMSLGEISTRLGFNVTSAFLATLGYEATTVKAAKLFHSEDLPAIGKAIIEHIESVCELEAA